MVVDKTELDRWGTRGLDDVFARIPGFTFYDTDFYGKYGPIGRGLSSVWRYGVGFELMPLVDFGHLVISPKWFKNIEVARGPAGLMWGSSAEAGLINFNLRDDLEGTEFSGEYGNYSRQSMDFMYGHTDPNNKKNTMFFGYHEESQDPQIYAGALAGMNQASNDWRSNGINPSESFIAKVQQDRLKVIILQDNDAHVAPVLWCGGNPPQSIAMQDALAARLGTNWGDHMEVESYRVEYSIPLPTDYSLYLYNNYYRKQWTLQSVATDTQRKNSLGFASSATLADGKLDINFGGDLWGNDETTSPSYTTNWADTTYGINWYDGNLTPSTDQFNNLYLQAKYALSDQFKVLLGARTDTQVGGVAPGTINSGPRVGLFYSPNNSWTIKYLYNSTARRPQANEATGSVVSPETLAANELIASGKIGKNLSLDLTLFTQGLSNEITASTSKVLLNSYYNTSGVTTSGFEWAAKYTPEKNTFIYWNGSYNQSKVNSTTVNGIDVSDPHNTDNEPLLVPEVNSFIGCEYNVLDIVKVNLDLRSVLNIPYQTLAVVTTYDKKSAEFVDLTFNSPKFWHNRLQVAFIILNLFDNEDPLPAYGEHIGNAPGLIPPEGNKYYVRATLDF